ncbi:hypothetical protein, partial [Salinibacterium sp.]|uniref:hypothetical protein n=1 Tax=Salinibacterium sp. TaxID=1915057 RepID=UPI00286B70DA
MPVSSWNTFSAVAAQPPVTASSPPALPSFINLTTDREELALGQSATLTATTDADVETTASVISIVDVTSGATLKSCTTGTVCTLASVSFYTGPPRIYVATVNSLTSNQVTVARKPWTVALTADKTMFAAGETVLLTASANQDVGVTNGSYFIRIYDKTTGVTLKVCTSG